MRRALARLLSTALTLAMTSVVALWALSQLSERLGQSPGLPLYFNSAPRNVHDLSLSAMQRLTLSGDLEAERELARLGGAALPHVLPRLDALGPSTRGRVAMALAPVARRMGVAGEGELETPELAAAFWARYWRDRSFDFRPQVARRLVGRLAQKSSGTRFDDIIQLDTYSLRDVAQALGSVRTVEDVGRAERLTRILGHVTGHGPVVNQRMSIVEARAAVRAWQNFWLTEGADFVTLDGPTRVVATFAQTRFGRWVGELLGVIRYRAEGNELGISGSAALASAIRGFVALGLSLLGGALLAFLEGRASRRGQALGRLAAALAAAVPAIFVLELGGAPRVAWASEILLVLFASALGVALVSRGVRAALSRRAGPTAAGLRTELRAAVALVPGAIPWIASSLFALEFCLDRDGVAKSTLAALGRGEINAGMTLSISASLLAVILVTRGDRDVASTRRRAMPSLVEVESIWKVRTFAFGGAAIGLVALLCVRWAPLGTPGWSELTSGARDLLLYGSLSLVVAALLGLALGAAAASGPQGIDSLLGRLMEISSGLPALLWGAAFVAAFPSGLAVALGLGLVRAVDVGWALRSELMARARADQELGVRSLGRLPLVAYIRSRFIQAAIPALAVLALTPAWLVGVQTFARACTLRATPGPLGWDQLLARPTAYPALPVAIAAISVALISWLLLALIPSEPRRLGAARPSIAPADPRDLEITS